MRILVTGHNGYIGSVMIAALKSAGYEIVGLDNYFFEECTLLDNNDKIPSIRKDARDATIADLTGFDAIIHLAALCNDPLGDLNPHWTYEINHLASVHLARLAKAAGTKRFLYASSCSLYGASSSDEVLTETAPLNPLTPYAISKIRAEEDLAKLADSDFSPVFMRNATVYGVSPRLRADIVLNNLVCWAFTTGKIRILSDGTPWRPIAHVEDIAAAFLAVLAAPQSAIHNQAFNVGSNAENYQVKDIAQFVKEIMPDCDIEYAGKGGPDPRNYRVNFDKLANAVDFQPKWNARQGAKQLYLAYQEAALTEQQFQGRQFNRLAQLKFLLESGRLDNTLRWRNGNSADEK
jgi:nucleoside-diphosphate-sugar epimerase